ncbi:hypothetical protein ACIA8O_19150 [Kitasatospora sp. NPDC051853]|uniref:hypothetical protein n=1 Tax=Kitasatospora sp. NPDC051853 TaxID=3364058 RepID=UPI00378B9B87
MSGLGVRVAMRIHPAAYRRSEGAELAAVFADTTAGKGSWVVARELVDLAGHGLRMRLGLGSDRTLAQLAALAAPFAGVAAMSGQLADQVSAVIGDLGSPRGLGWRLRVPFDTFQGFGYWVYQAALLITLAVAVAAVAGRWSTARALVPVGLLAVLGQVVVEAEISTSLATGDWGRLLARLAGWHGPQLIWLLILLAAPRDLLGPPTRRRGLASLAGLLVGGVLLNTALGLGPFSPFNHGTPSVVLALVLGVTELALLAVAVPALLRGRPGPAAGALAGAPVLCLMVLSAAGNLWNSGSRSLTVALLAVAVLGAAALARRRPGFPARRPPAAR